MKRIAATLVAALALCFAAGSDALAATTFSVAVTPPAGGTIAAPKPVTVAVRAAFSEDSAGTLPKSLKALAVAMPDGFATALAGTTSCVKADLEASGSSACPATSRLGSGDASFVFVIGTLRVPASTDEVSLFRGQGDGVLLYLKVTNPLPVSVVLEGKLMSRAAPLGPLFSLDFAQVAQAAAGAGNIVVTKADFDVTRGLAAGPCPSSKSWRFGVYLGYGDGSVEQRSAQAPCGGSAKPDLRVTARKSSPVLGARFKVALATAAKVRIKLDRRAGGRWVAVRTQTLAGKAGSNLLRIRSAHGKPLPRGSYRARVRATDASGASSAEKTVTFNLR